MSSAAAAAPVMVRLNHEAGILSKLSSPRIATLLDFGRDEDRCYWVRPYLPGESLEATVTKPLPLPAALDICRQILLALSELHDQGILGRNLTPSNLIIPAGEPASRCRTDRCWFGLQSGVGRYSSANDCRRSIPFSRAGWIARLRSGAIFRSVFGGAILFQLLAGRAPYQGATVGAVLLRHMTAHIPKLRDLGFEVPRSLDEIIQRLLRKDPRDRYQSWPQPSSPT